MRYIVLKTLALMAFAFSNLAFANGAEECASALLRYRNLAAARTEIEIRVSQVDLSGLINGSRVSVDNLLSQYNAKRSEIFKQISSVCPKTQMTQEEFIADFEKLKTR